MKPIRYIKATPTLPKSVGLGPKLGVSHRWWRLISIVFFFAGSITLSIVTLPIITYQLKQTVFMPQQKLIIPIPEAVLLEAKGLVSPLQTVVQAHDGQKVKGLQVVGDKDLTLVSNWFPGNSSRRSVSESSVTHYLLSIPKLKIEEMVVTIGGEDLKKSLIQYPGTALPGQSGNTVILGHSVLPMFYNPKNYETIFTTITELKAGDEILIQFDGITYTYKVHDYYERKPEQVDLMEQKFDRWELSLVTCVPPGTDFRRGIVRAYLENN